MSYRPLIPTSKICQYEINDEGVVRHQITKIPKVVHTSMFGNKYISELVPFEEMYPDKEVRERMKAHYKDNEELKKLRTRHWFFKDGKIIYDV